ncbi:hypothetical protein PMIN05_008496 [Paraphaeosphaeria minitans]
MVEIVKPSSQNSGTFDHLKVRTLQVCQAYLENDSTDFQAAPRRKRRGKGKKKYTVCIYTSAAPEYKTRSSKGCKSPTKVRREFSQGRHGPADAMEHDENGHTKDYHVRFASSDNYI